MNKFGRCRALDAMEEQDGEVGIAGLRSRCCCAVDICPLESGSAQTHSDSSHVELDCSAIPQNMGKIYATLIGNDMRPLLHKNKVLAIHNDRLRARNEQPSKRLTESEAGRQTYRELNLELTQQVVRKKKTQRDLIDTIRGIKEELMVWRNRTIELKHRRERDVPMTVQRTPGSTIRVVLVVGLMALVVRVLLWGFWVWLA
jgi:hypothetical protein